MPNLTKEALAALVASAVADGVKAALAGQPKADTAAAPAATISLPAKTREIFAAPCKRGFWSAVERDAHVERGCTAESTGNGHGLRSEKDTRTLAVLEASK